MRRRMYLRAYVHRYEGSKAFRGSVSDRQSLGTVHTYAHTVHAIQTYIHTYVDEYKHTECIHKYMYHS